MSKKKDDAPSVISFACRFAVGKEDPKVYEVRRDSLTFAEEAQLEMALGGVSLRLMEVDLFQLFSSRACPYWARIAVQREHPDEILSIEDFTQLTQADIRVTVDDEVIYEGEGIKELLAERPTSTPETSGAQSSGRASGSARGKSSN